MDIIIKRIALTTKGTFGVVLNNSGYPFALTCERPNLNNQPEVSCIPAGSYLCKRITSPSKGIVFEVLNVPNRSNILIHKGNIMEDSLGCILIGEQFGYIKDEPAVLASGDAFNDFMTRQTGIDQFNLEIVNGC